MLFRIYIFAPQLLTSLPVLEFKTTIVSSGIAEYFFVLKMSCWLNELNFEWDKEMSSTPKDKLTHIAMFVSHDEK
jgi:hypothetical protein